MNEKSLEEIVDAKNCPFVQGKCWEKRCLLFNPTHEVCALVLIAVNTRKGVFA